MPCQYCFPLNCHDDRNIPRGTFSHPAPDPFIVLMPTKHPHSIFLLLNLDNFKFDSLRLPLGGPLNSPFCAPAGRHTAGTVRRRSNHDPCHSPVIHIVVQIIIVSAYGSEYFPGFYLDNLLSGHSAEPLGAAHPRCPPP